MLAYFIDQIEDSDEKERAWQRYRDICGYAQSRLCRHRQICLHFGESPKWRSCEACDVCASTPDWFSSGHAIGRSAISTKPPATRRIAPPAPQPADGQSFDGSSELREYLRMWRRDVAKKQGLPAFAVMHDTSLDDLCRVMPASLGELRKVYGFGERKVEVYGREILAAISHFRQGARASKNSGQKISGEKSTPREETRRLVADGKTLEEVAKIRGCQVGSVVTLVASMVEQGEMVFRPGWVSAEKAVKIERACAEHGLERVKPIKDALPADITFDEIRLVVARLHFEQTKQRDVAAPNVP